MRANSLALRLFLSATAWTVVILLVTGIVLSSLYRAGGRARLRPPARRLSAHAGRRRRGAGGSRRQIPAVARRAAVRTAAVGLVLAGDAARSRQARRALLALAVGRRPAASRGPAACRRRRTARARAMSTGRRTSGCGWSSAPSISATRAAISSRSPATPPRSTTRRASFDRALVDHLRAARRRAAAHHHVPGALRPGAAQAHFRGPRRDPLRHRRAAGGRIPRRDRAARARDQRADRRQPRDRRARAHACRQSRACAEDAAVGDGQRGDRARRRSASPTRCASRPTSCATRWRAISSARGWPRA